MSHPIHPPSMPAWLESAWLARYLDRKLAADESAWFEEYMLDKPHLLRAVNDDSDLRDGLASALPAPVAIDAPSPGDRHGDARPDPAPAHDGRREPRWFAIAASLVVGIGGGLLAARLVSPSDDAAVIASPARIVVDTLRGEPEPPRVEGVDAATGLVIVDIAVAPNARDVVLHVDPSRAVPLRVGPEGFATALIERRVLAAAKTSTLRYTVDGRAVEQSIAWPR